MLNKEEVLAWIDVDPLESKERMRVVGMAALSRYEELQTDLMLSKERLERMGFTSLSEAEMDVLVNHQQYCQILNDQTPQSVILTWNMLRRHFDNTAVESTTTQITMRHLRAKAAHQARKTLFHNQQLSLLSINTIMDNQDIGRIYGVGDKGESIITILLDRALRNK